VERSRDIFRRPSVDSLRGTDQSGPMELFFLFLLSVLCAGFTGVVAESKGHNQASWLLGGLFFGPLALLASLGLADLKTRKYLRLLAEHQGAVVPKASSVPPDQGEEDANAQRRRILGIKSTGH
jgi:hypothetical protein